MKNTENKTGPSKGFRISIVVVAIAAFLATLGWMAAENANVRHAQNTLIAQERN